MISGPKNSRPTLRGWVNLTTGQIVKSERLTKSQIDEWELNRDKPEIKSDPLGLSSDPLGLSKVETPSVELDIPDDLGLEELNFDEDYKEVMEDFAEKRRKLGEAYLEKMRKTGEMDYYKSIISKTMRKK